MLLFCPNDGTLLLCESSATTRFFCKTCTYTHAVRQRITHVRKLEAKKMATVDNAAKNAARAKTDSTSRCICVLPPRFPFPAAHRSPHPPSPLFLPPSSSSSAALCPDCGHRRAYYREQQTRSADEPMTVFYECLQCSHTWSE